MAVWQYNPSDYTARNFEIIPEGDHRVRISNVQEKIFSTGNEGFEITLDVPGHAGKLWYYLVLDHRDPTKTNQRIGMFFDSFAIHDFDLNHYADWIGYDGAVRVKHSLYNGNTSASVAFCLSRSQQKKFISNNTSCTSQQPNTNRFGTSSGDQKNRFAGFSTVAPVQREIPADFRF
jgi:hypothetical protein